MMTFKRHKTLDEIRDMCREKCFPIDTEQHDKNGSDWITLGVVAANLFLTVVYSPWNGHFIVKHDDQLYTERSNADDLPWYAETLQLLYVQEENAA